MVPESDNVSGVSPHLIDNGWSWWVCAAGAGGGMATTRVGVAWRVGDALIVGLHAWGWGGVEQAPLGGRGGARDGRGGAGNGLIVGFFGHGWRGEVRGGCY